MTPSSQEQFASRYLAKVSGILQSLPITQIAKALAMVETAMREGRTVFIAGNGGSAATASHMANDLLKTVAKKHGRSVRVIALSDNVPLLTAIANDEDFLEVFSSQLRPLARVGDLLIVISGSGNSPNILRALAVAKEMGVRSIGFLGMDGGKACKAVDVDIVVPSDDYGPIEDAHIVLNHLITEYLRDLS
jgi:D-sedoheptulose 7-phosphate isomerase